MRSWLCPQKIDIFGPRRRENPHLHHQTLGLKDQAQVPRSLRPSVTCEAYNFGRSMLMLRLRMSWRRWWSIFGGLETYGSGAIAIQDVEVSGGRMSTIVLSITNFPTSLTADSSSLRGCAKSSTDWLKWCQNSLLISSFNIATLIRPVEIKFPTLVHECTLTPVLARPR